nr:MAG TPA: hypothetical protein [Caudoviricetes sp.]
MQCHIKKFKLYIKLGADGAKRSSILLPISKLTLIKQTIN